MDDTPLCSRATATAMDAEVDRLLEFTRRAAVPGGFGWLGDDGRPLVRDLELWITARMTHVAALGHLLGRPGFEELVAHGVRSLTHTFHDHANDGWYAAVSPDGARPTVTEKQAYGHAFVILAASSAQAAGNEDANDLLAAALAIHDRHFWDESAGMSRESYSADWRREEDYRGINANMHTVEAYLAAGDVTSDSLWHQRAGRIVTRAVDGFARGNGWRLPEHFDTEWRVLRDYNADQPAHPFRPYGATVGHALEWARLTLATAATLGGDAWRWATGAAAELTHRAVRDGWAADGADGFVYTTDWDGRPVVRARMHWVVAEGLGAAWALHRATGSPEWAALFEQWWSYAEEHLIDSRLGSWHHELAPDNSPAAVTWVGKPDVYHALQAMLLPRLPLTPSFASALRQGAR